MLRSISAGLAALLIAAPAVSEVRPGGRGEAEGGPALEAPGLPQSRPAASAGDRAADDGRSEADAAAGAAPALCSDVTSPDAEQAAAAKRLVLLGLCGTGDAGPSPDEAAAPRRSPPPRSGACSVVGEVGRSC